MVISVASARKEYRHGDSSTTALADVSLDISEGETVGLLGPNGAGKTTLIKCILGLTSLNSGTVSVYGIDPHENPTDAYKHVSAVLEGARNVYWRLTVLQNLRFFAGLQGRDPGNLGAEFDRILDILGLEDKRHETARNLSKGMKQKLSLGCTLARQTPIVFLDEPTLGLDVEAARDLRAELNALGERSDRTTIISSHDMEVVSDVCDRVVILEDGEVVRDARIETLLDSFQSRTYRVVVEPPFDQSRFDDDAVTIQECPQGVEIIYTAEESDAIYDLMDDLRRSGATVRTIETTEADLEETFVSIVGDRDGRPTEPKGGVPR